jgi:hypothetical protein
MKVYGFIELFHQDLLNFGSDTFGHSHGVISDSALGIYQQIHCDYVIG